MSSYQLGIYLLFGIYLVWSVRRGTKEWIPLVGAVIYAILFEHINMLRYAHSQGGYHYNPGFWFWMWGDVPLYIPLAWGCILATARHLTDTLCLQGWAKPFSDALLALLIDLSLDAVAIRFGFWYWHGVGLNEAFFGVPADNFVGWLLVSFTFSLLTRLLWNGSSLQKVGVVKKSLIQLLIVPPVAYIIYLGIEAIVHAAYRFFHTSTLVEQLYVLAGTIVIFAVIVIFGALKPSRVDDESVKDRLIDHAMIHVTRHLFHLFGIIGLLTIPIATRSPWLWSLTLAIWLIECGIVLLAHLQSRRGG